jgi:hypothetical protein
MAKSDWQGHGTGHAEAPRYVGMMDGPSVDGHAERVGGCERWCTSDGADAESRDAIMDLSKTQLIESVFAGGGEMGARLLRVFVQPDSG